MGSDTPSDPDEPRRGPVRRFLVGFFRDLNFTDWVEFSFYAFFALLAAAGGIAWLIGKW